MIDSSKGQIKPKADWHANWHDNERTFFFCHDSVKQKKTNLFVQFLGEPMAR